MKNADKASLQFGPFFSLAPLLASFALLSTAAWTAEVAKPAAGRADAAKPATAPVLVPRSVFVSNDPGAKDPFFPGRRGNSQFVQPAPTPKPPDYSELILRGITGTDERRIALINNQTFAKGDEGEVRMGNLKVKITVVEIRDKSVLIKIAGQEKPRELVLQDRILPLEQN